MSEVSTLPNNTLLSFIERASRDDGFSVEKFSELLRLQRDAEHDRARKMFNAAMAEAQAEMLPVVRDAKNNHLGNRYAKLETIDAAMRPIYTRHGFSVRYGSAPAPHEGWMRITCTIAHEAGYFEENYLDSPVTTTGSQGGKMAMTPVQAIGSTITYLRRYLLSMCYNIVLADDDDDGEATRRVAATATPRPERKVDPTVYDTPPEPAPEKRTWAQWKDTLEIAVKAAQTPEERGRLLARAEVVEIVRLARLGPYSPAKARIIELYEEVENRYLADPPDPPEPDLSDEALGEVEIEGAEKVAAGD